MRTLAGLLIMAAAVLFAREAIGDTWPELQTLTAANNDETGFLPAEDFSPDIEKYLLLEKAGLIRLFTMRAGDPVGMERRTPLVGYNNFFLTPHLHYSRTLWARQDVLYVSPLHRGRSAVRFIRWTDEQLLAEGVQFACRTSLPRHDHSRTLERMGYEAVEHGFVRRLG